MVAAPKAAQLGELSAGWAVDLMGFGAGSPSVPLCPRLSSGLGRSCFLTVEFCGGSLSLRIAFFQIKTGRDSRGAELEEAAQRGEVGTAGEPGGAGYDRHAPVPVAVTHTSSDIAPFLDTLYTFHCPERGVAFFENI